MDSVGAPSDHGVVNVRTGYSHEYGLWSTETKAFAAS